MSQEWRFILEPEFASGPANMAWDEALAVSAAEDQPLLRLYGWSEPTISLGRFQVSASVNRDAAADLGMRIVRRPTGGRALLHTDEVTYMAALPRSHALCQGGVLETYRRIGDCLKAALLRLGFQTDADAVSGSGGRSNSPACFEHVSAYETTVQGRKLVGSAQCVRKGYVLQHGSVPLSEGQEALVNLLNLEEAAASRLRRRIRRESATLASLTGGDAGPSAVPDRISVVRALRDGFRETLDLELKQSAARAEEQERAALLIRERYSNPDWTFQR